MKKGVLIYDKSDAEYNKWFINKIISTGVEFNLDIELKITEEIGNIDDLNICDFAIVRNRKPEMSENLESKGIRCFNSSYVCKIGNDKWEMYKDFSVAGIPVMYTQSSKLPFPCVVKPKHGHGGQNVFLVKNTDEYNNILENNNISNTDVQNDYIFQMPASEIGRDIRVYVVGDMILSAIERTASDGEKDFRANFSLGGTAKEYALNDDELKIAAKVANHIKADFVGIDLIYNNGKPIVNEIEDAVGTRMLYASTDIDPVYEYVSWISRCLE